MRILLMLFIKVKTNVLKGNVYENLFRVTVIVIKKIKLLFNVLL